MPFFSSIIGQMPVPPFLLDSNGRMEQHLMELFDAIALKCHEQGKDPYNWDKDDVPPDYQSDFDDLMLSNGNKRWYMEHMMGVSDDADIVRVHVGRFSR